jgi:hypothetical protein
MCSVRTIRAHFYHPPPSALNKLTADRAASARVLAISSRATSNSRSASNTSVRSIAPRDRPPGTYRAQHALAITCQRLRCRDVGFGNLRIDPAEIEQPPAKSRHRHRLKGAALKSRSARKLSNPKSADNETLG